MRTKVLLYCLFIVVSFRVLAAKLYAYEADPIASHEIDSMNMLLKESLSDSVRLKLYYKLTKCNRLIDIDQALVFAHLGLALADSVKSQNYQAINNNILGTLYFDKRDYRSSMFHLFRALRYYEQIGDNEGIVFAKGNIGLVYLDLNQMDKAKASFLSVLSHTISVKENAPYIKASVYINLGNIASKQKQLSKAIDFYEKAYQQARIAGNGNLSSMALANIGETYIDIQLYDSAVIYLKKALHETPVDDLDNQVLSNFMLGEVANAKGAYSAALVYLNKAELLEKQSGIRSHRKDILHQYYLAYRGMKNPEKALQYYEAYTNLKDSILSQNTMQQVSGIQQTYEVEKRDNQIQLLRQKQQVAEAVAVQQKTSRNFIIVVFALGLIMSLVIARNIILKQRVKNNELSKASAQAEKDVVRLLHENTEARYEVLKSKTNPHFLFNSLNILSGLVLTDPAKAFSYIEKFAELYRMILQTGDQNTIPLKEEMRIVQHYLDLQQIRFRNKLFVELPVLNVEGYHVPPFAIQLCVENVIKHNIITREENLHITISAEDEFIVIRNTLQKKAEVVVSTATGQRSIIERYALLTDQQPVFQETSGEYIVKLPMLIPAETTEQKKVMV